MIHSPGVPTHYMLADVDGRGEVRTISEPTLVDPEYYTPVTPKSDPGQTDLEGNAPADEGRGVEGRDRDRARVRTDHHAMAEDGAWLGGLDAVAGQPHRR
ncbi:hypothetical protein [Roseospira visakhapatnamensis]|uniref:Uncharacterized protein n=1 Tax=Roseospira visakhapatnamensis TaxID=390880 RepID=A0A7W6RGB4_9PROT|nr:hypothetical protein [Roseospira visakhapatnamensis]MBB4268060.1 hypothetical protein [Roseospira visakhapatnamensis]